MLVAAILVHCAMIIIMRCIIIIYNYIITVGWGLVADDVILPVGGIEYKYPYLPSAALQQPQSHNTQGGPFSTISSTCKGWS